jgi:hypothetical protein
MCSQPPSATERCRSIGLGRSTDVRATSTGDAGARLGPLSVVRPQRGSTSRAEASNTERGANAEQPYRDVAFPDGANQRPRTAADLHVLRLHVDRTADAARQTDPAQSWRGLRHTLVHSRTRAGLRKHHPAVIVNCPNCDLRAAPPQPKTSVPSQRRARSHPIAPEGGAERTQTSAKFQNLYLARKTSECRFHRSRDSCCNGEMYTAWSEIRNPQEKPARGTTRRG